MCCLSGDVGLFCFFQAEDGIRDLVRSRGLGDVYKRQVEHHLLQLALRHLPVADADAGFGYDGVYPLRQLLSLIHI